MQTHKASYVIQKCFTCGQTYHMDTVLYRCTKCGGLLDFQYDFSVLADKVDIQKYNKIPKSQGVWKYREFLPVKKNAKIISIGEGGTPLYHLNRIGEELGCKQLYAKFEGVNPTGSFKDRGMTVGVTKAVELGLESIACASTGNTSASLAAYAAKAGLRSFVFLPKGNVSKAKLAQAMAYGAKIIEVDGSFTDAIRLAEEFCNKHNAYFLNSINPIRVEGQKTVAFEITEEFGWTPPASIIVPIGNAGNISAIYKGFYELTQVGATIKIPKMIGIQPETVAPIVKAFKAHDNKITPIDNPKTIATALQCGNPVSWEKALNAIRKSDGCAEMVSDEEIVEAQKTLARKEGILCEPASACSLAGLKKLVENNQIDKDGRIVLIITGHGLKDSAELLEVLSNEEKTIPQVDASKLENHLQKVFA